MTPTPEDLARDLDADLALCDAATDGPWRYPMPGGSSVEHIGVWRGGVRPASKYRTVATTRLAFKSSAQCKADGEMIAEARTGWPAAVRRALAAEAEVLRLQQQLTAACDRIAAQSELLSRKSEGGHQ